MTSPVIMPIEAFTDKNVTSFYTLRSKAAPEFMHSNKTNQYPNIYKGITEYLAIQFGLPHHDILLPKQIHSNKLAVVDKTTQMHQLFGYDGLITQTKNRCICVQTADCAPVFLYDAHKQAVGIAHAGWRGVVSEIVNVAVEQMVINFGSDAQNIKAYIGPCISQRVYEVGSDVYEAFKTIDLNHEPIFKPAEKSNKYYLDIKAANKKLLLRSGLKEEHITVSDQCTYSESNEFYSARRDGPKTGRIISGIMVSD